MVMILMERRGSALYPIEEQGQNVVGRLPQREYLKVMVTQPRNLAHHRKFFAMLQLVFNNQERYGCFDHFLDALKIALGHCETSILLDGTPHYKPKSISFTNMDQTAFDEFYNQACDFVAAHVVPGLTSDAIKREVEEIIR